MNFLEDVAMATPTKKRILEHWRDWLVENCFDLGEPSCWACRKHWGSDFDVQRTDATWQEIAACWQKAPVQRCHIIPSSIGGTDDPSNLFLMCSECHDLAPNIRSRDLFLKWAANQSHFQRTFEQLKSAMASFELTEKDLEGLAQMFISKDFQQWFKEHSSLHGTQSSNRGPILTMSTVVGGLLEYRRQIGKPQS